LNNSSYSKEALLILKTNREGRGREKKRLSSSQENKGSNIPPKKRRQRKYKSKLKGKERAQPQRREK